MRWPPLGAAVALSARRERVARFAGSELARASALGPHGVRLALGTSEAAMAAARTAVYRTYWTDAAEAVGADLVDLGRGLLEIRRGSQRTRVWHNLVAVDSPVALRVAGDRRLAGPALAAAGMRLPESVTCAVRDAARAEPLLARVGTCVVKPAADTGAGTAVTCGVRDGTDLRAGLAYAARWFAEATVEEQVGGRELRVLVLDGEVLGTVERYPPTLVGDGRHTVAELVAAENRRRRAANGTAGLFPLTLDLDAAFTQRHAGRTLRTVLGSGVPAAVKTAVNQNGPAQNLGLPRTPAAVAELAARAASAVGLRLAAVELVEPAGGGAPAVLEVNSTPGLHYHYQVAETTYVARVARPLLERLLSEGRQPDQERS